MPATKIPASLVQLNVDCLSADPKTETQLQAWRKRCAKLDAELAKRGLTELDLAGLRVVCGKVVQD